MFFIEVALRIEVSCDFRINLIIPYAINMLSNSFMTASPFLTNIKLITELTVNDINALNAITI